MSEPIPPPLSSGPYRPDPIQPGSPRGPGQPKKRSGCLLAIYVLLGLGALVLVASAVGLYLFSQSEVGKSAIEAVKQSVDFASTASSGPEADALRAAGCGDAFIATQRQLLEVSEPLLESQGIDLEQAREGLGEAGDLLFVSCVLALFADEAPTCEAVATAFVAAAAEPPESFVVMVVSASQEPQCSGLYAADGSYIGELPTP